MKSGFLALPALLVALVFPADLPAADTPTKPAAAPRKAQAPLPDYIRFAEDARSSRLEVAIRTFATPSGQQVDLIGAVHIADAAYYQELNRRFESYDSVLFELVGDPELLTRRSPSAVEPQAGQSGGSMLSTLQQAASKHLNLSFQLDAIDYTLPNMVHADFSAEEFAKMQRERGETMLTLFTRAMDAQMRGDIDPRAMNEFDTFGLIRILMSQDSAAEFKKSLAKMFDQAESMTAAMEGKEGSVVLSGRNAVAVNKVREVLADRKQRHIAVFYGSAHMPGIETSLRNELGMKATGEQWLAAWTMPRVKPAARSPQP